MDIFYSLTLGGEGPVRALSEGPGISVTHRLCSPRTFLVCTLINPSVQDKARQLVIPLRVLFLAERWHTDVLSLWESLSRPCVHISARTWHWIKHVVNPGSPTARWRREGVGPTWACSSALCACRRDSTSRPSSSWLCRAAASRSVRSFSCTKEGQTQHSHTLDMWENPKGWEVWAWLCSTGLCVPTKFIC